MAKKFYAVRKGNKTGIFNTWAECQKQTSGFSGAEFKSFKTREEANHYMESLNGIKKDMNVKEENIVRAYVDGSYDHGTKRYACGAVILYMEEEIYISEVGSEADLVSMRNVSGELLGAIRSMEWYDNHCEALKNSKLVIYYDYEGIEKWATGAWQAKKEGTKAYVERYQSFEKNFLIEFVKVLAHSGDTYNEMADQLAKRALGLI